MYICILIRILDPLASTKKRYKNKQYPPGNESISHLGGKKHQLKSTSLPGSPEEGKSIRI